MLYSDMADNPWKIRLWILFIANCIAGSFFSPSTALTRLRVEGAGPAQHRAIERKVQSLAGKPVLRSGFNRFLGSILTDARVKSAGFSQNAFGRGILCIRNFEPVAVLSEERKVVLSPSGCLFVTETIPPELVRLVVSSESFRPSFTLSGNWNGQSLAKASEIVQKELPGRQWRLVQDASGKVLLKAKDEAPVILGTIQDFEEKISRLRRALELQPDLLVKVQELNLSSPSRPAVVP